mmetsp:Transcript_17114/g.55981  ORF Transcript_17114/g.55981 Transcript_17114/m.55981 type:complete len:244 (-) Transcript_17114:59-790(-)
MGPTIFTLRSCRSAWSPPAAFPCAGSSCSNGPSSPSAAADSQNSERALTSPSRNSLAKSASGASPSADDAAPSAPALAPISSRARVVAHNARMSSKPPAKMQSLQMTSVGAAPPRASLTLVMSSSSSGPRSRQGKGMALTPEKPASAALVSSSDTSWSVRHTARAPSPAATSPVSPNPAPSSTTTELEVMSPGWLHRYALSASAAGHTTVEVPITNEEFPAPACDTSTSRDRRSCAKLTFGAR